MKKQDKTSSRKRFSADILRDLQETYQELARALIAHPWLAQGSVNMTQPKSPAGSTTYTWTRKVRAKTVTVALSQEQSVAFRRAIEVNRQIESTLTRLRELSQTALLTEVPGVTRRRAEKPLNSDMKCIPK